MSTGQIPPFRNPPAPAPQPLLLPPDFERQRLLRLHAQAMGELAGCQGLLRVLLDRGAVPPDLASCVDAALAFTGGCGATLHAATSAAESTERRHYRAGWWWGWCCGCVASGAVGALTYVVWSIAQLG